MNSPRSRTLSPQFPTAYSENDQLNLITNEEEIIAIIKQKENQRWNYGLFVIFLAIASWMVATQLLNSIIKSGVYGDQPVFVGYTTGSGFLIYLLPEAWNYVKSKFKTTARVEDGEESFPVRELLELSFQVSFIYFLYNIFSLLSLEFTSSSQLLLLGTAVSFFTLILGSICKVEIITLTKFGILLLAILGVVLITLNDAKQSNDETKLKNPLLGDLLSLCGSFCYACYLIVIKVKIGETLTKVNERLLFGLVGLCTIIFTWPFVFLAHKMLPVLPAFKPPPNLTVWVIIILNGILSAISDYCCVILMLLTSPLLVSLSLTTSIPIGMICDSVFYHINNSGAGYYIGMLLILLSVVLTNMSDSTIDHAIEEALEDAILKDENLSPLLSPLLSPQFNKGVGGRHEFGFGHNHYSSYNTINDDISSIDGDHRIHEISVSGGYNHKYIIRGLQNY